MINTILKIIKLFGVNRQQDVEIKKNLFSQQELFEVLLRENESEIQRSDMLDTKSNHIISINTVILTLILQNLPYDFIHKLWKDDGFNLFSCNKYSIILFIFILGIIIFIITYVLYILFLIFRYERANVSVAINLMKDKNLSYESMIRHYGRIFETNYNLNMTKAKIIKVIQILSICGNILLFISLIFLRLFYFMNIP